MTYQIDELLKRESKSVNTWRGNQIDEFLMRLHKHVGTYQVICPYLHSMAMHLKLPGFTPMVVAKADWIIIPILGLVWSPLSGGSTLNIG